MTRRPSAGGAAIVAVLGLLCAAEAHARCGESFPSPYRGRPDPSCPSRDVPVQVRGEMHLSPRCDYAGVTFRFEQSNASLDCGGALLHSPDREDRTSKRAAITIRGRGLTNLRIENCFIEHYQQGVSISMPVSQSEKNELICKYWEHEDNLTRRYEEMLVLDEALRQEAPHDISIRNLHMRDTKHVGIYLYPYVHSVTVESVSVQNNHEGPGIYFDAATRDNRLVGSCLRKNAREGMAIDASAHNEIVRNRFEDNEKGGLFLYKNAFERATDCNAPEHRHLPRTQHASHNRIEGNVFVAEKKALWIASRAAKDRSKSKHRFGDPEIDCDDGHEHRRDFAEANRIVGNAFFESEEVAIVVEDDHTVIAENYFESDRNGDTGIFLGSRPRQCEGDPIYDTTIVGNIFHENIRHNVEQKYCATGTYDFDNATDHGARETEFAVGPPNCPRSEWRTRLAPALISTTVIF